MRLQDSELYSVPSDPFQIRFSKWQKSYNADLARILRRTTNDDRLVQGNVCGNIKAVGGGLAAPNSDQENRNPEPVESQFELSGNLFDNSDTLFNTPALLVPNTRQSSDEHRAPDISLSHPLAPSDEDMLLC